MYFFGDVEPMDEEALANGIVHLSYMSSIDNTSVSASTSDPSPFLDTSSELQLISAHDYSTKSEVSSGSTEKEHISQSSPEQRSEDKIEEEGLFNGTVPINHMDSINNTSVSASTSDPSPYLDTYSEWQLISDLIKSEFSSGSTEKEYTSQSNPEQRSENKMDKEGTANGIVPINHIDSVNNTSAIASTSDPLPYLGTSSELRLISAHDHLIESEHSSVSTWQEHISQSNPEQRSENNMDEEGLANRIVPINHMDSINNTSAGASTSDPPPYPSTSCELQLISSHDHLIKSGLSRNELLNTTTGPVSQYTINHNNQMIFENDENRTNPLTGTTSYQHRVTLQDIPQAIQLHQGFHPKNQELPPDSPQSIPEKKKSKRIRTLYTSVQLSTLEREFARNNYLDRTKRIIIAHNLKLSERQVKIWFQNRRMKKKKQEKNDNNHDQDDMNRKSVDSSVPSTISSATSLTGEIPFIPNEIPTYSSNDMVPSTIAAIDWQNDNNYIMDNAVPAEQEQATLASYERMPRNLQKHNGEQFNQERSQQHLQQLHIRQPHMQQLRIRQPLIRQQQEQQHSQQQELHAQQQLQWQQHQEQALKNAINRDQDDIHRRLPYSSVSSTIGSATSLYSGSTSLSKSLTGNIPYIPNRISMYSSNNMMPSTIASIKQESNWQNHNNYVMDNAFLTEQEQATLARGQRMPHEHLREQFNQERLQVLHQPDNQQRIQQLRIEQLKQEHQQQQHSQQQELHAQQRLYELQQLRVEHYQEQAYRQTCLGQELRQEYNPFSYYEKL